ncbi:hypothetical protein Fot_38191 [Forsythia ovata]|uniref:Uncharacterized protein n=1 Tax=Forsythia ovata TaxID=205694 RepID=A0ABD1S141_9LAMI
MDPEIMGEAQSSLDRDKEVTQMPTVAFPLPASTSVAYCSRTYDIRLLPKKKVKKKQEADLYRGHISEEVFCTLRTSVEVVGVLLSVPPADLCRGLIIEEVLRK